MRVEQENVHAVEVDPVHLGCGGQIEHRVEADKRFAGRAPFANEARPHCVVQFWEMIFVCAHPEELIPRAWNVNSRQADITV